MRGAAGWTLLLLFAPLLAGHATALRGGGPCDGVVDVACEDHYQVCENGRPFGSDCKDVPYRRCTVWVMYLDIVLPGDEGPLFCQDNPYHQP